MIELYFKEMEYEIRIKVNGFFYFVRKLPFFKKKSQYKFTGIKNFLIFASPLYDLFNSILKNLFSMLFIGIGLYLANKALDNFLPGKLQTRLAYHYLVILILAASTFSLKNEEQRLRIFQGYFHIDPARLYRMKLFLRGIMDFLSDCIAYSIGFLILGFDWYLGPTLALIMTSIDYMADGIQCYLADKKKLNLRSTTWVWIYLLVIPLWLGASSFIPLSLKSFLFNPLQLVFIVGGILGARYLYKYKGFSKLLDQLPRQGVTDDASLSKTIALEQSKLKEEDYTKSIKHMKKDLQGYNLLNELFFQRHRRLILKPIVIKSSILTGLFILLALVPGVFLKGREIPLSKKEIVQLVTGLLPLVCYFMYFQENLTKIIFVNCDQALLHYNFYRRPKDLLEMFTLRIKKLIQWNGIPTLVFTLGFLVFFKLYGLSYTRHFFIILIPLILWFFFSIHTMFLYYFFQPYTEDYKTKSPIYSLIQWAVYLFCWLIPQLFNGSGKLLLLLCLAAFIYMFLALYLVYKKAPKRFALRQ